MTKKRKKTREIYLYLLVYAIYSNAKIWFKRKTSWFIFA